ncbi:hypothetical protein Save01_08469 [Streptomyces avermitilis]
MAASKNWSVGISERPCPRVTTSVSTKSRAAARSNSSPAIAAGSSSPLRAPSTDLRPYLDAPGLRRTRMPSHVRTRIPPAGCCQGTFSFHEPAGLGVRLHNAPRIWSSAAIFGPRACPRAGTSRLPAEVPPLLVLAEHEVHAPGLSVPRRPGEIEAHADTRPGTGAGPGHGSSRMLAQMWAPLVALPVAQGLGLLPGGPRRYPGRPEQLVRSPGHPGGRRTGHARRGRGRRRRRGQPLVAVRRPAPLRPLPQGLPQIRAPPWRWRLMDMQQWARGSAHRSLPAAADRPRADGRRLRLAP